MADVLGIKIPMNPWVLFSLIVLAAHGSGVFGRRAYRELSTKIIFAEAQLMGKNALSNKGNLSAGKIERGGNLACSLRTLPFVSWLCQAATRFSLMNGNLVGIEL